jgi:hypothetical protein
MTKASSDLRQTLVVSVLAMDPKVAVSNPAAKAMDF